ncbi:65-kDa microtubule-associated protein 3 [Nicotiana sylvestris]|uniref:65-kDa microtubule-associated protein 3-like isoform X1 n=1 Tax=Nicotiana sylvestris TaxID=4096 RepID=A0A1U7XD16_NICSY|nr:PREDICTED: 65-kDa microtubule-associated protein 3-like isoform X1 [Nicotiana sylvestris]XP_009789953.1 PREDICTED: 65-kDa microtubule-associated protein 3-like isoform X1 [Nicotiana sylvestris]
MHNRQSDKPLHMETTCGSLLSEMQRIWDEMGEPEIERDKMLFELQQECLEIYKRKVNQASRSRAQLQQTVANSEAELAKICAALGEQSSYARQSSKSLNEELKAIKPKLEEMKKRKRERMDQFAAVVDQIQCISKELCVHFQGNKQMSVIDENDLSVRRLEEMKNYLIALQKEKSDRLKLVLDHLTSINSLCVVLGIDYKQTIVDIDPTMDDFSVSKNISKDMIIKLSATINRLKDLKKQRLLRLQDIATTLVELWNLMDTPLVEQQQFHDFTRHIAASENEINEPNILSLDSLQHAEAEVSTLQEMKSTKMKEVLLRKRLDLEEICRKAHMIIETQHSVDFSVEAIESGANDPSYLLEKLEVLISKVKEEAFSRRDILEKVEKWLAACDEECWLEEYNRDENRYHGGRGTHRNLKRAEKARVLVNKIPAMVETLRSRASAWQKERGHEFLYDGVALLSMVEQYCALQREKELERQRQRDQKKLQGQLMVEQEALFGSIPSPLKSAKKNFRPSMGGLTNKRLSLGGAMLQTPYAGKAAPSSYSGRLCSSLKQQTPQNSHQTGRRDSFMAPKKQQSCKVSNSLGTESKQTMKPLPDPRRTESTQTRKPLSPLSSMLSSNASTINIQNQTLKSGGDKETPSLNKTPLMTPTKIASAVEDRLNETMSLNRTPVMAPTKITSAVEGCITPKTMTIPMPATPSTVSIAMQTAMTPAALHVSGCTDDIEYSFEERRAGYNPLSHTKVINKCLI